MPETTQTASTAATPPAAHGWCAWHKGYSEGVRLIQAQDAGSGPSMPGFFACTPCRGMHRLVPLADRP
ncbi:hypothetical protein [Streptomyces sp. NPDC048385]|uniref:hypothetical protein n=1 Tax=unclassified Streptomyces TaxID=2593676 RepID=UPI00342EE9BC